MTRLPRSTYRLQIRSSFTLHDAAAVVPYLHRLGVDTIYLSPILTATSGSDHGYDMVDPTQIDPDRGGAAGLTALASAARAAGMGVIADIVPNHMGVSQPRENAWWWDVLENGQQSRWADAFDIDWAAGGGKLRLPTLGDEIDAVLARNEISVDLDAGVLRYFDHEWPLAPGSVDDRDGGIDVDVVLSRQHYAPMFWQREATQLNYRRFFGVSTLAAVRVEEPWVFEASHAEIVRWVREGLVDGLRVDHPDGLADPAGYLERLSAATGTDLIYVEKILEHAATDHPEQLPGWWETTGTTGYDAMAEIDRFFIDPRGEEPLTDLDRRLRADTGCPAVAGYADVVHDAKRMIADTIQGSEIARLVRLLDDDLTGAAAGPGSVAEATDAIAELLTAYPVYRSYLPTGMAELDQALTEVARRRPDLVAPAQAVAMRVADRHTEFSRRFMQTTGPVMAKGVEDTAFYRWTRLGTLTEVGGDPSVFALDASGLHRAFAERQAAWPLTLTDLSTHDTKRGEDVRARLSVLSEAATEWTDWLAQLRDVASTGHGPFDSLLWQAIIGSWPAAPERLHAYAEKAAREAGEATTWWNPNHDFETRMHAVVDAAYGPARHLVADIVDAIAPAGWRNSIAAKVIALAGPGVPDVYQGSERWETSLVDPDNRRAVDFDDYAAALDRLDHAIESSTPPIGSDGLAKLLITSRTLRTRRDHPELFTRYRPLPVVGPDAPRFLAFDRGGAIVVVSRWSLRQTDAESDAAVMLPPGDWVDVYRQRPVTGGVTSIADLLDTYPGALLVPAETGRTGTAPSDPTVLPHAGER